MGRVGDPSRSAEVADPNPGRRSGRPWCAAREHEHGIVRQRPMEVATPRWDASSNICGTRPREPVARCGRCGRRARARLAAAVGPRLPSSSPSGATGAAEGSSSTATSMQRGRSSSEERPPRGFNPSGSPTWPIAACVVPEPSSRPSRAVRNRIGYGNRAINPIFRRTRLSHYATRAEKSLCALPWEQIVNLGPAGIPARR